MQGTFQRDLSGQAGDLLARQSKAADRQNPAAAAAAAAAPPAAAGPAPAMPTTVKLCVYPPSPKFTLDGKEYYVIQDSFDGPRDSSQEFYWTVPYVIEQSAAGTNVGRPESQAEPLPDGLKDANTGAPGAFAAGQLITPPPDPDYARVHVDYAPATPDTLEVSVDFLQRVLDASEKMEYDFALRMQGLLNCGLNAVWTCTDFGFDAADRGQIMEKFLEKYIGRFLSQVTQRETEIDPDSIVREALQMHSRFSAGWTKEHKRGLAPSVDSCSEALVSNFCDGPLKFLVLSGLTRKEIARFLRRDPVLSPQFGLCLNFFMVKMDQDRNGRNANYKSMFNATSSNLLQLRTLEGFLRSHQGYMQEHYAAKMASVDARRFEPLTMDWYYVVSQLHVPTVRYTGVKRARARASRGPAGLFFSQ